MDEVNHFAQDQDLPTELTVSLRAYFRNTVHLIRTRRHLPAVPNRHLRHPSEGIARIAVVPRGSGFRS